MGRGGIKENLWLPVQRVIVCYSASADMLSNLIHHQRETPVFLVHTNAVEYLTKKES